MSDNIRHAIQIRNNLQNKLKKDRQNIALQNEYKTEKKRVTTLIRNAQSTFYNEKFNSNRGNTAEIWKLLRDIVPNNKAKANQHSFDNINAKVEEFNFHFANVGKTTYESTQNTLHCGNVSAPHPENISVESDNSMPQSVDTNTVILTVKDLKNTNSVGSDDIPLKFVIDGLYVIAFYLTCIVNTSLVTGVFPNAWKHAVVVPILENGDVENVNNYRPISLLPVI